MEQTTEISSISVSVDSVMAILTKIADPEIPTVSIVELGLVESVRIGPSSVEVDLRPTSLACPATELIRQRVIEKLAQLGRPVKVSFSLATPWTSELLSERGRRGLVGAGIAPPRTSSRELPQIGTQVGECPFCGSAATRLENSFGPTPCRAIAYCDDCRQPFEQFKEL